ncbi:MULTISPECIES: ATP phosphoribosyltransferase regulatory subunit [Eubacterium]|uniref:ATP phosphoribosyltransferase regulatory subunit n=1 Tax=Eubacterium album TaxID=2978477 RepID=A0ABT2M1J3_9FIRM|nr:MULTISPECIES: ATP phosphoribosyltransferase regulatory subunit [unclassified Eubacterium (in: firmicutes)]MCT7399389.1 ATP phosphoribosyltransferase regulatory subunit [Eubacterium sp. LFL-14]
MSKELLHTPEGVRDVYGKECARKLTIENKINNIFNLYGFHNVQTPTFEFFDIFNKERGSVPSKNLYKFFDREGNTLVLRPDLTPSIARIAAKNYMDVNVPIKLCYNANTYINNSELQGKLKEITQLGCELIGDDSVEADAEMVALVVNSLKSAGFDKFLVEIGQVDFYKGLLEECGFEDDVEEELRVRIENKNFFGVEELLDSKDITSNVKDTFLKLPSLFGSSDVLDKAKELATNEKSLKAIEKLEEVYSILVDYGVADYISFDLGMLSNFNYYTGIIFKAYTYGTGDAIVAGGRYDKLLSQFGKDSAAIGFAVYMDQLLMAMSSQKMEGDTDYVYEVLIYDTELRKTALQLATGLREKGIKTELIPKKENISIDEYVEFKKEDGAVNVTYVSKDGVKEL